MIRKPAFLMQYVVFLFLACFAAFALAPCNSQAATDAAVLDTLNTLAENPKFIRPSVALKPFAEGATKARFIVLLNEPDQIRDALSRSGIDSEEMPLATEASRSQRRGLVAQNRERVITALKLPEETITNRFQYMSGFSVDATLEQVQAIAANPDVASIEEDGIQKPMLAQGIPLISATTPRSTYTGDGMAVAITDTGVDYNHPMLGGGSFPNSKVIGGRDTGQDDDDPMDGQGHGTACAGISAGNVPGSTVGDYIGGVGYGAKIYALKITYTSTGGSAYDSDTIEAWEWCVTNQNNDPNNPIMVISHSFGGSRYYSVCDTSLSAMATAAANVVAAGITLLASSGNDGFCDSMGGPACVSDIISVGAVYDANFGTYYPCVDAGSCATKYSGGCDSGWYAMDNTAADMVTSYSNSASFLDIFAPSNQAYTTGLSNGYNTSFGGTSAACPYAAGATLVLQDAAKTLTGSFLTPAQVRSYLANNGDSITDGKVAITKPRVNLANAVAALPGGGAGGGTIITLGGKFFVLGGGGGGSSPEAVGDWNLSYDWGCNGSPSTTIWTLNSDSTCSDTEGNTCTWSLNGSSFRLEYDGGRAIYTGTLTNDSMSGTMIYPPDSSTGCWTATSRTSSAPMAVGTDNAPSSGAYLANGTLAQ